MPAACLRMAVCRTSAGVRLSRAAGAQRSADPCAASLEATAGRCVLYIQLEPRSALQSMTDLMVKALTQSTWPDFAALVERHHGVWGGCWCLEFHPEGKERGAHRREAKEQRVRNGTAHAALVYDGGTCVGWCQFGAPEELPRIKHLRVYSAGQSAPPQWRITCFFVDKNYRGKGVSTTALAGALEQIARLGGGTVESYPEDAAGRTVSGSFLYNGRLAMFERQGFQRTRRLGKHHWVVTKAVQPQTS
jgi:GNAT superfamily N-acetyltransferase